MVMATQPPSGRPQIHPSSLPLEQPTAAPSPAAAVGNTLLTLHHTTTMTAAGRRSYEPLKTELAWCPSDDSQSPSVKTIETFSSNASENKYQN